MRLQGIESRERVDEAYIEEDGRISVISRKGGQPQPRGAQGTLIRTVRPLTWLLGLCPDRSKIWRSRRWTSSTSEPGRSRSQENSHPTWLPMPSKVVDTALQSPQTPVTPSMRMENQLGRLEDRQPPSRSPPLFGVRVLPRRRAQRHGGRRVGYGHCVDPRGLAVSLP